MNEELVFRAPTADDAAEYISYRQAFLDAGDSMDGTGAMRRFSDPAEWLAENARYADPATLPEGKVLSTLKHENTSSISRIPCKWSHHHHAGPWVTPTNEPLSTDMTALSAGLSV